MRLFDARKRPVRRFGDVQGKPGEIVGIAEEAVTVSVQGGTVEIARVRTGAGQKMSAAGFVKSQGLTTGDRLESEAAPGLAAASGQ